MEQQVSVYLVNGSIYEYNPAYASEYDSEWVTAEVDDGFFTQQDSLARQRAFLDNATVTADGTETVDGVQTHVLDADVDEDATSDAIMALLGGQSAGVTYNVTDVDQRVWVDTETDRPVRTELAMNATITAQNQTATMSMDAEMDFEYDRDVDISLPEEADSAVSLDNETGS